MKYFIDISIASYLTPYVVPLDLCTIIGNYVKSENDTIQQLHWFCNGFKEAMGDLCRCISDDIDYSYVKEDPECTVITMESMYYMVLTTAYTDTYSLSNNLPQCLDPDNI